MAIKPPELAAGGGGAGTVTSVDVATPSYMGVSGNPITTSGTVTLSFDTQTAGKFFGSPAGSDDVPTFRAIEATDVPGLDFSKIISGAPVANDYAGGATSQTTSSNVTLTSGSTRVQKIVFEGDAKTITLPNATTLDVEGGAIFVIDYCGTNVSIVDNGGNLVYADSTSPTGLVQVYLVDNSSANGVWLASGIQREALSASFTPTVFNNASTDAIKLVKLDSTRVLAVYEDVGNSSYGTACVINVGANSLTVGAEYVWKSSTVDVTSGINACLVDTDKVIVTYTNSNSLKGVILTMSGDVVTTHTETQIKAATSGTLGQCVDQLDTNVIICGYNISSTSSSELVVLTISGTTITVNTPSVLQAASVGYVSVLALSPTSGVAVFKDTAAVTTSAVGFTISGTTITVGTEVTSSLWATSASSLHLAKNTSSLATLVVQGGAGSSYCQLSSLSLSGSELTINSAIYFNIRNPSTTGAVSNACLSRVDNTRSIFAMYGAIGGEVNSMWGHTIATSSVVSLASFGAALGQVGAGSTKPAIVVVSDSKAVVAYNDTNTAKGVCKLVRIQ